MALCLASSCLATVAMAQPASDEAKEPLDYNGTHPASRTGQIQRLIPQASGVYSVAVIGQPIEQFEFSLDRCERVRATAETRYHGHDNNQVLTVRVHNRSPSTCSWSGIILDGFMTGQYQSDPYTDHDTGIHLKAGETIEFTVRPDDVSKVRDRIRFEANQRGGALVFTGFVDVE